MLPFLLMLSSLVPRATGPFCTSSFPSDLYFTPPPLPHSMYDTTRGYYPSTTTMYYNPSSNGYYPVPTATGGYASVCSLHACMVHELACGESARGFFSCTICASPPSHGCALFYEKYISLSLCSYYPDSSSSSSSGSGSGTG